MVIPEESGTDGQQVRSLIDEYVRGSYEADVGRLRQLFDPMAQMNGFLDGTLVQGSPEPFFEDLGSHPSLRETNADFRTNIELLAITGNIATVVLRATGWGARNFIDLFHLMKKNGQWCITTKTFTTYE